MKHAVTKLIAFVGFALNVKSVFAECPNLADLRSDYVKAEFDGSLVDGFWYEVAYQDIAQIGESCQCFNKTYEGGSGSISEKFGFTYQSARSMNLLFSPTDTKAVYTKSTSIARPSASSAIPTVVVDVGLGSSGEYATITEYSCFVIGPITYQEIRIGSRSSEITDAQMTDIEQTLTDAGLTYHLKNVEHPSTCEYNV